MTHGSFERDRAGPIARLLEERFGWGAYRALAILAFLGCIAVLACDVAMWVLRSDYNPVRDTISAAAAGPKSVVQDAGLVAFAMGVLALAIGFTLRSGSGGAEWAVRIALALLSTVFVVLAVRETYAKPDPNGLIIHDQLVVLGGALVALVLWLLPAVAPPDSSPLWMRAAALVWAIAAGLMGFVPEAVLGLYERALALVLVLGVAAAAWKLYRRPDGDSG